MAASAGRSLVVFCKEILSIWPSLWLHTLLCCRHPSQTIRVCKLVSRILQISPSVSLKRWSGKSWRRGTLQVFKRFNPFSEPSEWELFLFESLWCEYLDIEQWRLSGLFTWFLKMGSKLISAGERFCLSESSSSSAVGSFIGAHDFGNRQVNVLYWVILLFRVWNIMTNSLPVLIHYNCAMSTYESGAIHGADALVITNAWGGFWSAERAQYRICLKYNMSYVVNHVKSRCLFWDFCTIFFSLQQIDELHFELWLHSYTI